MITVTAEAQQRQAAEAAQKNYRERGAFEGPAGPSGRVISNPATWTAPTWRTGTRCRRLSTDCRASR